MACALFACVARKGREEVKRRWFQYLHFLPLPIAENTRGLSAAYFELRKRLSSFGREKVRTRAKREGNFFAIVPTVTRQ